MVERDEPESFSDGHGVFVTNTLLEVLRDLGWTPVRGPAPMGDSGVSEPGRHISES